MALEMKDKELVAIGASIGAGCRPCIDHHIGAGRDAGLTEPELARAVEVAEATQRLGAALLTRHVRELLHREEPSRDAAIQMVAASRADELTGLGASIGANCHPLLEKHISGALQRGLTTRQLSSAIKMAEIVHQHAADITAKRAVGVIDDLPADHVSYPAEQHRRRGPEQGGIAAGLRLTAASGVLRRPDLPDMRMLHVATAPAARRHVSGTEAALAVRPDRSNDLNSWRRALRSGRCQLRKRQPCGDAQGWRL